MLIRRKSMGAIISVCAMLLAVVVFEVVRYRAPGSKPLGEGPRSELPAAGFSESAWRQFLDSDFKIVTDLRALPGPVLQTFTEQGGSRLLTAGPGERFEATDLVQDASVPRERLIFAGVAGDKCFVHYAQGGRGLTYVVEFFGATSNGNMKPLWKGYCHVPAANIQDLRRCMYMMRLLTQDGPP
jgi:hypothetical protein